MPCIVAGHREKVFAIIGVKVYAAGVYMNPSLAAELKAWNGKSASDIQGDGSLYSSIFQGDSWRFNCLRERHVIVVSKFNIAESDNALQLL